MGRGFHGVGRLSLSEEGGADVSAPNGFDRRAALGELFYGVLKQTKLLVAIVILGLLNRGAV